MRLLLTSEGVANQSIAKALVELLPKPIDQCRVVFIPTAGNPEPGDKQWIEVDMDTIRNLHPAAFEIVDISVIPKDVWMPIFEKSDIIAVGGGHVQYLNDQIILSGVKEELPRLLESRVYMGISAGSMVTAKTISLSMAGLLYYEQTGKLKDIEGLGFIDFEIRPHLNSPDFPLVRLDYLQKLSQKHPQPFYAIDDNTAIQVIDGKATVISEGQWKKFA